MNRGFCSLFGGLPRLSWVHFQVRDGKVLVGDRSDSLYRPLKFWEGVHELVDGRAVPSDASTTSLNQGLERVARRECAETNSGFECSQLEPKLDGE